MFTFDDIHLCSKNVLRETFLIDTIRYVIIRSVGKKKDVFTYIILANINWIAINLKR